MVSSSVPDHFILVIIACPCHKICVCVLVGAIRALFRSIVTPAVVCSLPGVLEFMMSKLVPKQLLMSVSRSSSRCISWRANMAIFSFLSVLFIIDHLSM
jgi:hypothetical protein